MTEPTANYGTLHERVRAHLRDRWSYIDIDSSSHYDEDWDELVADMLDALGLEPVCAVKATRSTLHHTEAYHLGEPVNGDCDIDWHVHLYRLTRDNTDG